MQTISWYRSRLLGSVSAGYIANNPNIEYRSSRLKLNVSGVGGRDKICARKARYAWFASEMLPGDVVVTAHHLDDQVETVLFRLFRGSGVKGLSGIPSVSQFGVGKLFRPFSDLWRTEIHVVCKRTEAELD